MIKDILKRIIPSYRIGESLLYELNTQRDISKSILQHMEDLDYKNEYLFWLLAQLSSETSEETKKRVFLNMPAAKGELRRLQLAENFLLQRVKEYCDRLNIRLFLRGGTALGAVRHKGFIPWDDDIDIGMLDTDYIILKAYVNEHDELIHIQRYFQYDGGSVVKVKYRFTENIFIDIFISEFLKVDGSEINTLWAESQNWTKHYSEMIIKKLKEKNLFHIAEKTPIYDPEIEKYAYEYLCEHCECFISNIKTDFFSDCIASGISQRTLCGYWLSNEEFPLLIDEVTFEGKTYDMLNGYENRLLVYYGDIYEMPRTIKTTVHHQEYDNNLILDLNYLEMRKII